MGNEFDLTVVEIFEEFLGYPKTSGGIRHSRVHRVAVAVLLQEARADDEVRVRLQRPVAPRVVALAPGPLLQRPEEPEVRNGDVREPHLGAAGPIPPGFVLTDMKRVH